MLTMLAVALATTSPAPIRNHDVNANTLRQALEAPQTARRPGEGPRYCVVDDLRLTVKAGKVCRSKAEWVALGVVPVRS